MTAESARRRPRRWIAFFAALAVMGAAAVVVPIVYNLSIQLRPEQLAEARGRWRENAPADYDLDYLIMTTQAEGEEKSQYRVEVRGGRVVYVELNGELLGIDPALAVAAGPALPVLRAEEAARYGVPALFDEIEAALRRDAEGGRGDFARASFDPRDGHPYHYVHRVRGKRDRVEWNVKMRRIALDDN